MYYRELTATEKRFIKELVIKNCANYCGHYKECLPLDSVCYMMNMHYFDDTLCKYFQSSILPLNPSLENSLFKQADTKQCGFCDGIFVMDGKKIYCSPSCARKAKQKRDRENKRKRRGN